MKITKAKLQRNWTFDDSIGEIKRVIINDIHTVPFDPANTDYQEYLEWVAAGNTAEAAD